MNLVSTCNSSEKSFSHGDIRLPNPFKLTIDYSQGLVITFCQGVQIGTDVAQKFHEVGRASNPLTKCACFRADARGSTYSKSALSSTCEIHPILHHGGWHLRLATMVSRSSFVLVFLWDTAKTSRDMLQDGVLHRYGSLLEVPRGGIAPWGSDDPTKKVPRDMWYRSDSIAKSRALRSTWEMRWRSIRWYPLGLHLNLLLFGDSSGIVNDLTKPPLDINSCNIL